MKNSKLLSLALVIPFAACLMSACGNPGDGKLEIRFLQNTDKTNNSPIIEAAAEAFNKDETANPGLKIKVNAAQDSASYDKLLEDTLKKIPTGDYCDIFYGYPDSVQAINKYNVVQNLDEFIRDPEVGLTEEELNAFVPAYLQEGKNYPKEGTYSMPFSKSTEVMYYNKDIIGIDLSQIDSTINAGKPLSHEYINNLTWEDLLDHLCPALLTYNESLPDEQKIIKAKEGKQCVFAYDSDSNFFITLSKQYGYPYTSIDKATKKGSIDFDNENMANLMVKLHEAYAKGYLQTQGTYSTYTSNLFNDKAAVFTVSSTAGAKNTYNSNFETVPAHIPHAAGKQGFTVSQGPSIAILTKEAAPEKAKAAWRFYKYFLKTASLKWAVNTGYLPILESDYETDVWQAACDASKYQPHTKEYNVAKTYSYIPEVADDLFDTPVFSQSSAARTKCGSALTQSLLAEGTFTKTEAMQILTTAKNEALNA